MPDEAAREPHPSNQRHPTPGQADSTPTKILSTSVIWTTLVAGVVAGVYELRADGAWLLSERPAVVPKRRFSSMDTRGRYTTHHRSTLTYKNYKNQLKVQHCCVSIPLGPLSRALWALRQRSIRLRA